ncbi:MAG: 16S rRNA (adenine(1518)-N(6)/adenine(1519)-N(6))-dimethyltransferase RsmA [Firmicutes bacterium]|nr:16S rRNA (adenine(1518)-N(6)/adenine(1519)-N(6))-dimethyltransferase RsmA [Bacillota bacterium]
MDKLYSPSTMAKIREKHGFRHSKSLGQNFLSDIHIIEDIVDGSDIEPEDLVIEIGPGMGVLTAAAAERAGKVIAVEIDKKLIPILKETLAEYDNVEIINADIMKTDLTEIVEANRPADGGKVRVIGNLPYYITTPIIMKLLEESVPADSITIMMQKEVADRIKAEPGGKDYGALTVAVGFYCTITHVADAPKEVFVPRPKVDSTVIRLDLRKECPVDLIDQKIFFETVKGGFGQRRKTLLNSLTGVRGLPKPEIADALDAAGIDPKRRAETLSLDEFAAVANEIARRALNRQ